MQYNFFQWIRDGVKQSVLLGVSDAIDQIGTPDQGSEMHEELRKALTTNRTAAAPRTAGRKRLGKSLKDLEAQAAKS